MLKNTAHRRGKYWLGFVAAAILVHLLLFVGFKQSYFSLFSRKISPSNETSGSSFRPDVIITIPVLTEPEEDTSLKPREDAEESTPDKSFSPSPSSSGDKKMEDLVGEGPVPRPQGGDRPELVIPPRPLELSWPDPRGLEQCLGHSISLRIRVDPRGRILKIVVLDESHPRKCIEAALDAAEKIIFEPGSIAGKPDTMWTEIRMDFKRQQ
jgi:hypothetical protein